MEQTILPPPYHSAEDATPYSTTSSPIYPTTLPAFDTPRNYSRRLREIAQQRSKSRGVYLTIHIPSSRARGCKIIEIIQADISSSSSSSSSSTSSPSDSESSSESLSHHQHQISNEKTPLLGGGIPLVEDIEAATFSNDRNTTTSRRLRKRSKRGTTSLRYGKKELSWLSFISMVLFIFMIVGSAAVFAAWAVGFSNGRMVGFANFKIGSGEVANVPSAAVAGESTGNNNGAYGGVGGFVQKEKDVRRSRVWRRTVVEESDAPEEEELVDDDILFA